MAGQLPSAPSFSVHSVAESSGAAISEAEEIHEVHKLLKTGEHAFKSKSYQRALRCYNEALEIDELSIESLAGRAAVYIEMGNYQLAQKDAEKVISMDQENTQGHYLLGIAMHNLGYFRESLLSFLKALNLDADHHHVDVLTNNIATITSQIVSMPDPLMDKIPEMDPYKKLTEIGCCLYQGRKYDTCIKVLSAAQKLETNQKGITMKVQLTLANAHAALKHNELAVSLYQECLQTALSAHDASYQTKSLVSIASLFLELGDTHQAIVHYQKLLDLQHELQGEDVDAPLPDYWSKDLQCALHLNLSIAYKTIGNMRLAVRHARIYCHLIEGHTPSSSQRMAEARSQQNVGMLYEVLGQYSQALEHYKKYLALSKEKGHKRGIAQAYGCLGSVYAHLNNRQLSITYHEQHIAMSRAERDARMLSTALELCGDSHMVLDEFEQAADRYDHMFHVCPTNDVKTKTTGMCKLGAAYRKQQRYQYAIFYFEQARDIAEDFDLMSVRVMCDYHIACMLQYSTQHADLDRALQLFSKLIPVLEAKLSQHQEEDTFCPDQLHEQISECYDGIQSVLGKMGNGAQCLQYSEGYKKKYITQVIQGQISSIGGSTSLSSVTDAWSVERLVRAVSQQSASVLYFQLLPEQLLAWLIQPGKGIVRFYTGQSYKKSENYITKIQNLTNDIKSQRDMRSLTYDCENRALPPKNTQLDQIRNVNKQLSEKYQREKYREELAKDIEALDTQSSEASDVKELQRKTKPPERQLFDILVAPFDDLLGKLEEGSPLVVVPDKSLYECPFWILRDWNNKMLQSRLRISLCPSIFALDRLVHNELNQLKLLDDLEFERTQARLGGVPRLMQNIDFLRLNMGSPDFICLPDGRVESRQTTSKDNLNLRQVSNPRLVTSGILQTGVPSAKADAPRLHGESTLVSMKSRSSLNDLKDASVPFTPRTRKALGLPPVRGPGTERTVSFAATAGPNNNAAAKSRTILTGAPTSVDKMVSTHTLSTLTTRTSTNTDITQSHMAVTEFSQISDPDRCLVIGAPKLPTTLILHGQEWRPAAEMEAAEAELYKIADYCDVTAVVGEYATKDTFLEQVRSAAVVHIATLGCLKEGLLVFTPNSNRCESGVPSAHSYIVTIEELVHLRLVARLVVLSVGQGPADRETDTGFRLASAFLAAGAQCVVSMLWSAPNKLLDKFYHHFYAALQQGCYVSAALETAAEQIRQDDRYQSKGYWASPVLIGKDVFLSVKFIRHAQLDQMMDKVEEKVSEGMDQHLLNPRPLIPKLSGKEENRQVLQECIAQLLADHKAQSNAVQATIELIDDAIKRLHVSDINQRTAVLPAVITRSAGAMRLIKYLGFHFQARGADMEEPYVIFPHWNHDELLIPAYESLKSAYAIVEKPECSRAVHELLPTTQDNISYLVDMLSITRHAPEIQLKVTDLSVRPLWKTPKIRALLHELGYQQIGTLLYFNSVQSSRKLLMAAMQLLIAFSVHKTSILLHKLDVNLLGGPSSHKGSVVSLEHVRLPTLMPILLPRNQMRMSTPWLSNAEHREEMGEKMKLSRQKSDVASEYQFYLSKARTWHQTTVAAQANNNLDGYGRPQSTPYKVKVVSGASASQNRKPVDATKEMDLKDTDIRRDYAHYVYKQRLDNVTLRHKNDILKLYSPYIINA